MSEQKPTLNAGSRIKGANVGTINLKSKNTVLVRGQHYSGYAGSEFDGVQMFVINDDEQNLATNVEEEIAERHREPRAGQSQPHTVWVGSKLSLGAEELGFQINGRVTIFNEWISRDGSEVDIANLKKTFSKRGVAPTVKLNLKYEDIVKEIDLLSTADFSGYKLFVCIVMSHGHKNGMIWAADREYAVKPTIIDPIMKNKTLNGIPKIFIIVACRGREHYRSCDTVKCPSSLEEMDMQVDGTDGHFLGAAANVPYLISYSTLEGLVSYRSEQSGTFFIQSLCKHFDAASGDTDINSIFTKVNQELANEFKIQAPVFETTMGKICFKDLAFNSN